jgi:hypothetical protein
LFHLPSGQHKDNLSFFLVFVNGLCFLEDAPKAALNVASEALPFSKDPIYRHGLQ